MSEFVYDNWRVAIPNYEIEGKLYNKYEWDCTYCHGDGYISKKDPFSICPACNGSGTIGRYERVSD